MDKYLERRWAKAQGYMVKQVRHICAGGTGNVLDTHIYDVASSAGGWWPVKIVMRGNRLISAYCPCPDFGTCKLHGVDVCGHALAASLHLYLDAEYLAADSMYTTSSTLGAMLHDRQF